MLPYPPPDLMALGSGVPDAEVFDRVGQEFLTLFKRYCGLKATDHVLDIGCGPGRMARALSSFLSRTEGSYDGMDVSADAIDWCLDNISPALPSFQFHFIDVCNTTYNPHGSHDPSSFTFPFGDGSFEAVFLASVFTHMLPDGLRNYLAEIRRVLKVGGRCLATYFLLNAEQAAAASAAPGPAFHFPFRSAGKYAIEREERPEDVVAYEESFVRALYDEVDLAIVEPMLYGSWCGRRSFVSSQDIVIATRNP